AGAAGTLPQRLDARIARDEPSGAWLLENFQNREPLWQASELPPSLAQSEGDANGAVVLRLRRIDGRDVCLVVGRAQRAELGAELRSFLTAAAGLVSSGLAAAAHNDAAPDADEGRRNELSAMLPAELHHHL